IDELEIVGLRRIADEAVRAQISSRSGARLDLLHVEADAKTLGRLGWFDEISVETQPAMELPPSMHATQRVRLVFRVVELPYLTKVEYTGSRLLSTTQIEKLLGEN